MAYTLDPATLEITIPKADLTSVGGTLYVLDTETFRDEMNTLLASADYIWMDDWTSRNAPVTVGGVTLAQTIEMINGYNLTFDDSGGTDQYSVRLEGSNNNLFDIQNGILNANLTQVIPTNSAGLTYSKQVEDSAYLDQRIWVDTVNGTAGTTYPLGTPALPCLSFADALGIQAARGLPLRFRGVGAATVSSPTSLDTFDLLGASHGTSSFTINSGVSTEGTIFERVNLVGTLDGEVIIKSSTVGTLTGFEGEMQVCGLSDTITLATSTGVHEFVNCYSTVSGTTTPAIDCNSLNNLEVSIRNYTGGIEIQNYSGASNTMSIDLVSGHVVLASTCTDGTIVVRGTGHLTDNSGAGCTVVRKGLTEGELLEEVHADRGLAAPKTITENAVGTSYDEATTGITKEVRKSGSVTTITRS